MYLSRAQCLRALEALGLTTVLYTSPYAGPDNALIPLQRMLDAVAFAHGEDAPTITPDGRIVRRRASRQPEWLQEVYGHLAWRGLPIQDITAWHVAHLLRKTYRVASGSGQPARSRPQVAKQESEEAPCKMRQSQMSRINSRRNLTKPCSCCQKMTSALG